MSNFNTHNCLKKLESLYGIIPDLGMDSIMCQNSTYESYYDNGVQHIRCTFLNGKINGEYESWYSDKTPFIKCSLINGKIHGLYQEWYNDNKIGIVCKFEEGKCVAHM